MTTGPLDNLPPAGPPAPGPLASLPARGAPAVEGATRPAGAGLLVGGLVLAIVGGVLLYWLGAHAPTLEHLLLGVAVVSEETYAVGRIVGFGLVGGGALLAVAGVVRLGR